jgi:hypothetical protein
MTLKKGNGKQMAVISKSLENEYEKLVLDASCAHDREDYKKEIILLSHALKIAPTESDTACWSRIFPLDRQQECNYNVITLFI